MIDGRTDPSIAQVFDARTRHLGSTTALVGHRCPFGNFHHADAAMSPIRLDRCALPHRIVVGQCATLAQGRDISRFTVVSVLDAVCYLGIRMMRPRARGCMSATPICVIAMPGCTVAGHRNRERLRRPYFTMPS